MSQARELAEKLIGTCSNDNPAEILNDDAQACAEFDEIAFCCDGCGWWCSTEELNNETGNQYCDECKE